MVDDAVDIILGSGLFDAGFYRDRYFKGEEVSDRDLARHYLENGSTCRFRPSPRFDSKTYYYFNDDVKRSGINPLLHYEVSGRRHKRQTDGDAFRFDPHYVDGLNAYDCEFRVRMEIELPVRLKDVSVSGKDRTSIGAMTSIGPGCVLGDVRSVGRFCTISEGCVLSDTGVQTDTVSTSPYFHGKAGWANEYLGRSKDDTVFEGFARSREGSSGRARGRRPVTVGNDVWICRGSVVSGGVSVGDGAIVMPSSVVVHDVPPYAIVAGNPARTIGARFDEATASDLLDIGWWEYGPGIMDGVPYADARRSVRMLRERVSAGALRWEPDTVSIDPFRQIISHKERPSGTP